MPACLPASPSVDRAFYKFQNDVRLIAFSSSFSIFSTTNQQVFSLKNLLGFWELDLLCLPLFLKSLDTL